MKLLRLLILFTFISCCPKLFGQQLIVDIGRVNSSFDYQNSEGNSDLKLFSHSDFSYSVGYRKELSKRFHYFGAGVFSKYGSFGTDSNEVHDFRWDVSYAGLEVGVDGEVIKFNGFSVFIRAAASPQFLVKGTQRVNTEVFSLKGIEEFDTPFLFLKPGLGFNYCADDQFALSLKYNYGIGSPMGSSSNEELKIITNTISLGLLWSLGGCTYCHNRIFNIKRR